MKYPEGLVAVVRDANARHPADAAAAVKEAAERVRRHGDYAEWADALAYRAVMEMVHAERHAGTVAAKRAAGAYGGGAKVAGGDALLDAHRSFFDAFAIGGTCLGDLTADVMGGLEAAEREKARGCLENAELLRWLRPRMKNGRKVRECVKEADVMKEFRHIRERLAAEADTTAA